MSGIYNAALIDAANRRPAKDKLHKMGGILASSPELMEAVGSNGSGGTSTNAIQNIGPTRPMMAPQPMPMSPQAMPTMQQFAPQPVPMPPPQAPRPPAPAVPTVQQPTSPRSPMGFEPGGPVDIQETPDPNAEKVTFMDAILKSGQGFFQAVMDKFGTGEDAEGVAKDKVKLIADATKSENPAQIADAVMVAAEVTPNAANKQDFAQNVFGLSNVDNIDEINDRIARVAVASSFGKSPDEFAQAVLLGLTNYKQTAAARAGGGADGEKARQEFLYNDVYRQTFTSAMTEDPENPAAANALAREAAVKAAPRAPSAIAGGGGGGGGGGPSAPAGVPVINTQEEYDALPPNTDYVDPNGVPGTKPE